jgi:predicted nuclease of predicted toxin-antitoxin system
VLPLLLDEGLPATVAHALSTLNLTAHAVGDAEAPVRQSSDEVNCAWCAEKNAVLVTNDRGKKDRTILDHLAQKHVHAIFVHNDLRDGPEHLLAKALLIAEPKMEAWAAKHILRHRLQPGGGLKKRP